MRRRHAWRPEPRVGSGLVVSLLFHVWVLTVFLQVAWMTPATTLPFDVFAAAPLDVPTGTAVGTVPAIPPRPGPAPVARRRPGGPPATAPAVATTSPRSRPVERAPAPPARTATPATPTPPPKPAAPTTRPTAAARPVEEPLAATAETRVDRAAPQPSVGLEPPPVAVVEDTPAPDAGDPVANPPTDPPRVPALASALQPVPASPLVASALAPASEVTDRPLPRPAPSSSPVSPLPDVVPPATPLSWTDIAVRQPSPPPDAEATVSEPPPATDTVPTPAPPAQSRPAARPAPSEAAIAQAPPPTTTRSEVSSLGLGLGRLRIHLDGARSRTTERETEIVSGTLAGGEARSIVVQVEERTVEAMRAGRAFTAPVTLAPGVNRVRVQAIDADGGTVEETITVQYVPPVVPDVVISSPLDGHTLGPDDPPLVVVRGDVRDSAVTTVWVVANDRRVPVPVSAGSFQYVLPLLEPTVRLHAETGGETGRSATVAVHASAALPSIGLWLTDWPRATAGPPHVTVSWRANAGRLDGGVHRLPMRASTSEGGEGAADFFYLRNARPGVYALELTYRAGATQPVRPVLYVAGSPGPRAVQPVTLDGSGRAVLARILLPQGVLWDQDDWFTGRSASGDTVTKFRFPDGVSWTERVGKGLR